VICFGSNLACEASEPRAVILNEEKDLAAAFECQRLQSRSQGDTVIPTDYRRPRKLFVTGLHLVVGITRKPLWAGVSGE